MSFGDHAVPEEEPVFSEAEAAEVEDEGGEPMRRALTRQ